MTWNDEEYWSLRKHDCKNWMYDSPPSNSIFKRVGIRHFCACDFSKAHHFERSCRFFCLILESGMENCHFPRVDFKSTLAFQALPIFWSRTRGNGRSQANGSGWSKMLSHLNLIVSRPRLNKTFEICDLAMPAISGMNATPGKPGAPICLGNHATVYHFQRRFLEVKSCLFRPSVLYVFLRHLYGYLHHFSHTSVTFAHAISTKFIILNAVVVFLLDSWKWHGKLPLSKSCL